MAASLAVTAVAVAFRGAIHAPSLRATIETALTIFGLAGASLGWSYWKRTHRLSDLLIVVALFAMTLQDFEFLAAPAMLGSDTSTLRSPAFLTGRLVLAVLFACGAIAPRRELDPRGRPARALIAVPAMCLLIPAAVAIFWHDPDSWFMAGRGWASSAGSIAMTVPTVMLLSLAVVRFVQRGFRERDDAVKAVLGAALILFAGAVVYGLLMPGLTTGAVSGQEYLRAGAYGLILIVALRMRVRRNLMEQQDAAARERRRLIGDLHDGMAQDLAFIAAYAEKLARDLGPDHPMVLAARRALAFSRETIVDLAASDAPTAGEALKALAGELTRRHGIQVAVQTEGEDLQVAEREAVVRIAREAIVNAVRHGGASNVTVSLHVHAQQLVLTISDDGRGLSGGSLTHERYGYGSQAMHQRAEAIGGQMRTWPSPDGGLAVEVTVP